MTLIIAGSPRKGKYSDRIAETYRSVNGGEIIYARNLSVAPCIACSYCKKEGKCFRNDDMNSIIEKFRASDKIVIVSPIYWWQVTGTIKPIIDRLYALDKEDYKGKTLTVIMNGESDPSDKEYELLEGQFKEMTDYIGMKYEFLGVGTPEDDEEYFQKGLEQVRKLAAK